jgi:anti-sigma B factor antagonist
LELGHHRLDSEHVGDRVNFAVAAETRDDRLVVRIEGELDMANVGSFEDALAANPGFSHVVVDLGGCTFLDSTGVRAIASAARQADSVSIVAIEPGVIRVLEITALDTIVSIHPSLDDALALG